MGHFASAWLGVCFLAASTAGAAQGPATAAFPPTKSAPAAASGSAAAPVPLPPPPPPPPASDRPASATVPVPATPPNAPAVPVAPPAPAPAPVAPAAPAAPPYPGYAPGYAQPGYAQPGYGYYYPAPMPRVRERFPDDAAASSAPFIDALVTSVSWQNRVSQFLDVGVQAGTYVARRVRLTGNILFPTSALTDDYNTGSTPPPSSGYYQPQRSKAASVFYGFSAGIVAVSTPNFVLSPGVLFSRTDVADYGSSLAFSLPFEWVTSEGLRLGLEFDAGRAFGGSYHQQCFSNFGSPSSGCGSGPTLTQDRPTGTTIVLQFELGFGFNHPDPLPQRAPRVGSTSTTPDP